MKILFINLAPVYGGAEIYLKNLINELIIQEHEIFLAVSKLPVFFQSVNLDKKKIIEVEFKYQYFPIIARKLNKLIVKEKIDIVFFNGHRSIYLAPLITKHVKKICVRHTTTDINFGIKKAISNLLGEISLRFMNRVIVISKYHKFDLTKNKICNKEKIEVIYNGIDVNFFKTSSKKNDRKELRIIQIGRLERAKGQLDTLIVFKKIYETNKNIKLLLVGEGSSKIEIQEKIQKYNLNDAVEMLGFRSDIKELLNDSDIFLLPSYFEGLPLSILEAMSMGIPTLSTKVGGISEIISDGENGFLIEPGNLRDFELKLLELIKNLELREKFSQVGQETIRKKFSLEQMVENIRNSLRNL